MTYKEKLEQIRGVAVISVCATIVGVIALIKTVYRY